MSDKKDASIGWMYDGAKSSVNREDYLLGKKVDKNFEKYSDVVNEEKPEQIDSLVKTRTIVASSSSGGLKKSTLQTEIIRSEDPFVAVRVREETKRRELMDNPLMKMKLQKMLKSMMAKPKKEKKKSKKRRNSPTDSDSESEDDRKSKRRRSPSPRRRKRSRSRSVERRRRKSPERRNRSRSRSRERRRRDDRRRSDDRSRSNERRSKRDRSDDRKSKSRPSPRRTRSRSSSWDEASTSNTKKYDSHVPTHLKKEKEESDTESEGDDRRSENKEKKQYGLVEMRKRRDSEKDEDSKHPSKEYKLVKFNTGRGNNKDLIGKKHKETRRKLTDEEKAAKLAEMQDNAKWRDDERKKNLTKHQAEAEDEKKELDQKGYAPSFIRTQMRAACDDLTVEKHLQSKKGGVQRNHGYMNQSFARK